MMKILLLTPSPPNEYNRIRLLNELKVMNRFAEITLISLITNKNEADDLKRNSYLCKKVIGVTAPKLWSYFSCFLALFKSSSLRSAYCNFPEFHKITSQLSSENFDLIYIKRLRMAQYARYFDSRKIVIDATDSMGLYYERLCQLKLKGLKSIINHYESKRLSEYEKQVAKLYQVVVCSKRDSSYIEQSAVLAEGTVEVIPNVVDLEKFKYKPPSSCSNNIKVGFFGVFSAATNEDAAWWLGNEIYPHLQQYFSSLECEIVGLFPSKRLLSLHSSGLKVTGYVPNISDRVYQWNAFLCPLRSGAGVKNKILQCLALGVPIIATFLSLEGLRNIQVDKHLLLANNAQEFAKQLMRLNKDPELALKLSLAGRQYVEEYYSLESLEACMKEFCQKNIVN